MEMLSVLKVKKQRRREDIFVVLSREADALRVSEHFPDSERKESAALLIHGQQKDAFREVMEYLLNQSIAVEKIEKCEITLENRSGKGNQSASSLDSGVLVLLWNYIFLQ